MGGNTSGAISSRSAAGDFLAVARLFADPLVLVAADGRIHAVNDGFVKQAGVPLARILGSPLSDFCSGERDELLAYLCMCSGTASPLPGACTSITTGGPPTRWRMLGALFRPADVGDAPLILLRLTAVDAPTPFTSLNREISDLNREVARRVAVEEALTARQRELHALLQERERWLAREREARMAAEAANRLKDDFLAVLSHELRTPLNAIIGWARMLESGTLSPDRAAHAVEVIARNAQLQRRVVEDLLDVSSIMRGKLRLELAPIDVGRVVRGVVESVRPASTNKGITLTLEIDPAPLFVMADEARLQQIVWNLLSNAVKFTPAGGRVAVAVAAAPGLARITVADTGRGFPPEFVPALFQPFRQADPSVTRAHGGLGLGLVLVRQLVEAHGGRVEAESAGLGAGARFTVTLPASVVPA